MKQISEYTLALKEMDYEIAVKKLKDCHCELFDWLSKQDGVALVNDDFGHWAVATSGMQNVPRNPPDDIQTTFFIEKAEWKDSIEEAIKYAIQEQV